MGALTVRSTLPKLRESTHARYGLTIPMTIEERVSRLEGGQEHLANKADVESVKVELERIRGEIKDSKISTIIWLTGVMVLVSSAQVAAGVAFFRMLSG